AWRANPAPPTDVLARTLTNLATTERALGRYAEAETAYQEALALLETDRARYASPLVTALANLADLYRTQEKLPEARRIAQRAVKIAQDLGEDGAARLLFALQMLAAIHRAAGSFEEAGSLYRLTLARSIALNGENHPTT